MGALESRYFQSVGYPNHPICEDGCKFIYLSFNPQTRLVKIGVTNTPKTRARQIVNSSGMNIFTLILLELLPEYDESPQFIEKFLHNFYIDKRVKGEWFRLSIRDIIEIRNLFYEIYGEDIQDEISEKDSRSIIISEIKKHLIF